MRRSLILISASLLVLSACSKQNPGNALPSGNAPSESPSSTSTGNVPGPGVPKVETPIDIAHFQQAPCDSLTAAQVKDLLGSGVTPKTDLAAPAGPSCSIHPAAVTQASVVVIFGNVDKLGLTGVYRAKGTTYPFFKPLDAIDGYPIVAYDAEGDQSSKGRCTVALGTSDTQTVDIAIAQSEENIGKKDPCEAARGVASLVLGNIRGGS